MYSNKILNFQESTTILNACTKKSGNLLNEPHKFYVFASYGRLILPFICIQIHTYCMWKSHWSVQLVQEHTLWCYDAVLTDTESDLIQNWPGLNDMFYSNLYSLLPYFQNYRGISRDFKLFLNLSLYFSRGLPTLHLPTSSCMYIRILGILSSLMRITWLTHLSCDWSKNVSIPPNLGGVVFNDIPLLFYKWCQSFPKALVV